MMILSGLFSLLIGLVGIAVAICLVIGMIAVFYWLLKLIFKYDEF